MQHVCVNARFKFWDNKQGYTVEYLYSCYKWYIFKDEEISGALWWKEINPAKSKSPSRIEAANILEEYLEEVAAS